MVARAMEHSPDFEPGTGWSHSNTGYVLLGMIVERTVGHPWPKEVESRILKPLGMDPTYLPGTTAALRSPHANGGFNDPDGMLRQHRAAADLVDRALCDTPGSE
ncbi:serine hydrolase [Streptomyces sp. NPDC058746]|uniref:serine hydrolase n=1 Tax=Streptomyces sp. NPDC058746 TaxID=3346622 RepID=UPI0036D050B7